MMPVHDLNFLLSLVLRVLRGEVNTAFKNFNIKN
jgi:hypothetical protein